MPNVIRTWDRNRILGQVIWSLFTVIQSVNKLWKKDKSDEVALAVLISGIERGFRSSFRFPSRPSKHRLNISPFYWEWGSKQRDWDFRRVVDLSAISMIISRGISSEPMIPLQISTALPPCLSLSHSLMNACKYSVCVCCVCVGKFHWPPFIIIIIIIIIITVFQLFPQGILPGKRKKEKIKAVMIDL